MGLLGNLLGAVWQTETSDWTFGRVPPDRIAAQFARPERLLEVGVDYLNIELRSMRITHVRKGTGKYFPAVHSFVSVDQPIGGANLFHVFTSPNRLREIDEEHVDRVLQGDQRLVGPTPYYGAKVAIEIALFSIKSADLAAPYVSLLSGVSASAGTAFVGSVSPLLPLLSTGVELLTKTGSTATLEIGIDRELSSPMVGCYVAARAKMTTAELAQLRIGQDGRLQASDGSLITSYPYFVFTIEGTRNRKDWAKIPELSQGYASLLETARGSRDQMEAVSQFDDLKRRLRLSLDVVPADAEEIIQWIDGQLTRAFPAKMHSSATGPVGMEPLENLPLYQR